MVSNQDALQQAINALTGLNQEHDAIIAHAFTLARLVDEYPTEVKLHSEYRQVLNKLVELGAPQEIDSIAELVTRLKGDT